MEQGMSTGRPAHMMSFADSVKGCMQKSFTMQGRASRSEYWFFVLFNLLLFNRVSNLMFEFIMLDTTLKLLRLK